MLMCLVTAASAQSMSVNIGQRGAFQAGPGGGGIFTGNVNLKTEVQFPPNERTVTVGGFGKGTDGTSSRTGRSDTVSNGGGGYSTITVTPVPVITGAEERPLTGLPGKEVLALLSSGDASDRLSAAAEIGRRNWNPRARKVLSQRLAQRLGDESPRVAGAAAKAMASLGEPDALAALVPHLRGRDPERIVPLVEALGCLGDERARPALAKLADHIDLEISLAASKALTALERRARK